MELNQVLLPFGKTIYQSLKGQPVSSDTGFFVQYIADHYYSERAEVLELGSGCGIISVMLGFYREKFNIHGMDILPELVKLSSLNAEICELKNVNFEECDLVDFAGIKLYDLIITNPPYYAEGTGRIPPCEERAIARFEIKCTMSDVFRTIKRNLKPNGSAFIMYPFERYEELSDNAERTKMIKVNEEIYGKNKNKKIIVEVKHA
ncbi:MAG: hypothetical protein CSB55_06700 [Candidatus Cloacimonadota bacterium]|nr:MAG: hypothetical protein CSB55_06700 [Candidatus Cloacimonadota bacterium]